MRRLFRHISKAAVIGMLFSSLVLASHNLISPSLAAWNLFGVKTLTQAPNGLELEIANRLKRVQEFQYIEQEAAKLGVRAWLFGGTAAGYAHYVKWDLQREKGDKRFQPDRFDYDYTNIYRSTQDLDIVIDGNAQQAQALQSSLAQKYPHLQGSKTAWEVRLLTQDMGDKQAILNNSDFMNQHTDSNSTGLIEITKPKVGESVVRDVRDWNSKESHFLKDVHDGALHYYFSPLHESTTFAKEGRNPPILSVIRFLTKAFQYELKLRPEDLEKIKKVIDAFDPKRDTQNSYVNRWIGKNGKKLVQNAVNIEYAVNTLDQLGLRKKLEAIKGNVSQLDSLAWWMNKEPLETHALGTGEGKTAKELGLDVVAHETNNFLAYESITRAHTGDPNVFISRENTPGEDAVHGNGFYTKVGRDGARGSGLTIRFHLRPEAREGTDFVHVPSRDYVVIKNKSALRVIPESLNIGPVEYFQMLAGDEMPSAGDNGVFEKLKRRIEAKTQALTEEQEGQIVEILKSHIAKHSSPNSALLLEWFSLPGFQKHLELIDALVMTRTLDRKASLALLSLSNLKDHPDWIHALMKMGTVNKEIGQYVLSNFKDHPDWIHALIEMGTVNQDVARYVLSQPQWTNHPELVEAYIKKGMWNDALTDYVLSEPHWKDHPEFVEEILKAGKADWSIAERVLSKPHWKDHPEWVETLIKKGTVGDKILANYVLSQPHWKDHPELRRLANGAEPTVDNLRLAFKRGESVHMSHLPDSGNCVRHHLEQSLK